MKYAFNPYLPSYEYVPDGEPRVFGDRVYIYGSHDAFDGKDFCTNDYVCWSAPVTDLANWRYEGVIYRRNQDPNNKNGKMTMCAPDCVQGPDGRYYLYYEFAPVTYTSVAVCDTPAGQYEFYGYVQRSDGTPYGTKRGEVNCFDPSVLVEDNGDVYLYTGFSPKPGLLRTMMGMRGLLLDGAYCLHLAPDMLTIIDSPRRILPGALYASGTSFVGHAFFEASSIRKIGETYYFVYSSELSHELCFATAASPYGPFSYGGTIISIGDVGYKGNITPDNYTGNTHGGMVEINGHWYIFYHRQTNKQKCARQGCAEPIVIEPDGSIAQVEMTSCGLNNGPLPGIGRYEARIACILHSAEGTFPYLKVREKDPKALHPYLTQSGYDREDNPDQYIANLRKDSVAGFKYFAFTKPSGRITIKVRSQCDGVMEVSHSESSPAAVRISVNQCEQWQDFSADLTIPTGTQPLYFRWCGDGACDFKEFLLE